MPGGRPLGVRGTGKRASARIPEVPGGQAEAEAMFRELAEDGSEHVMPGYPGQMIDLPGGRGAVGLRPRSKTGPPTIDVNVIDSGGNRIPISKIKFIG